MQVSISPLDVVLSEGTFVAGASFKRFENELAAGRLVSFCAKRGKGWKPVSRSALLQDMLAAMLISERDDREYAMELISCRADRFRFVRNTILTLGIYAVFAKWPRRPEQAHPHLWGSAYELCEGLQGLVELGYLGVEQVHGEIFYMILPRFLERIRPLN